ncbi:MAG: RluA family pseudouridine synthase [Candidatus Desulforudis sp.]|nr:RluA family pseudouridine synthase [Desulforudis sp.]
MTTLSHYTAEHEDERVRLDVFLAEQGPELSRSRVQKLISAGLVLVNGEAARAGYRLKAGDRVCLEVPEPEVPRIEPEDIPLDIYYDDADVVVVNKPRGLVVHPAVGHYSGTLVNALLHYCRDLSSINGVLRPGIVHRLDRDTSGLLMVAKNDSAHLALTGQLQARTVLRRYTALVHGHPRHDSGTVDAPIGRHPKDRQRMAVNYRSGRRARTHYRVLQQLANVTLLELTLETGRTHQIRVHMHHLGHPLVGDLKYGHARPEMGLSGQFLHAGTLGFSHPRSGEFLVFEAPLPPELAAVLARLTPSASR